ncbi:uncharacterized protein [Nicotiana sylvestris]|uniref:uncharacterized protein n=1 Tax=Nicotiana sylvestris TaxID=4096 RepID=UPI00388C4DFA
MEDGPDPDASFIFDEAHQLFKQAVALHKEAFSKSQAELARCEESSLSSPVAPYLLQLLKIKLLRKAKLKKISKERDDLKTLYVKKEEEISDLRAVLAKAHQEQTELIKKDQQKGKLVEQLRDELKMKEAETLGWRQGMDSLSSEKDTLREQLASSERHLQSVKEDNLARGHEIEELKANSVTELSKAKSDAEAFISSYRADAEATNTRAKEISTVAEVKLSCALDHARRQSWRETLEEVHARGFDLSVDIEKAKILEEEAAALLSNDEDSANGSESGEDEYEVPDDEALEDAAPEDATAEDVAPE